ncbi:MAG TPA: Uma2 family endonuclease [Chloroflexota bacterium]|nr:Uma2 family endonuclease [Chloroflexota bacterium]
MLPQTSAPWAEPAPITADILLALPEDGWRYELVHGRLVRMSPTNWEHGAVTDNLYAALRAFVTAHRLGRMVPPETGFDLTQPGDNDDTVLAADVAFVRADRLPRSGSEDYRKFPHLAPDLVAEVVSPSQYHPEMAEKARLWLAAGVRLVWMVWPAQRQVGVWLPGSTAPALTLGEQEMFDGRDVLPGFTYPVAQLFT